MKQVMYLFSFFCLFLVSNSTLAQENGGEPRNKIFEKKSKERAKEQAEAEKELLKHHQKIQSKATRKRMKQNKKRSKRLKKQKTADPFWKKWFRK